MPSYQHRTSFGYDFSALSGNSGVAGVIYIMGARKDSMPKPQAQLKERELRRGIERWENEGGRLFPRVKGGSEGDKGFAISRFLRKKTEV